MTAVNVTNYQTMLPIIIDQIKKATYVSIDLEFSGLAARGVDSVSLFDKPEERYDKLRRVVLTQKCIQLGISVFKRDHDSNKNLYHVDAWNIFCMEPSFATFNSDLPSVNFDMECLHFYCQQKFDFNSLMIDDIGAPFLNANKRNELEEYLRKYPDFKEKFPEESYNEILFPKDVRFITEKDRCDLLDKLVGVSKIIEAISKYKTPIVGHNMILDLIYLYHQFHADLPENYVEFKENVAKLFYIVYDTKYMTVCTRRLLDHKSLTHVHCDRQIVKCSGLFVMYQKTTSYLKETPHFPCMELSENIRHYKESLLIGQDVVLDTVTSDNPCHEAAFDAIVTGAIFLYLAHMSARINKEFSLKKFPPSMAEVFTNTKAWQYQIYLARATVSHIYLLGHDPQSNRPNWFKVTQKGSAFDAKQVETLRKQLERIGPIDLRKTSPNEIIIAGTSGKLAPGMKRVITESGYHLEIVKIEREPHHYNVIKKYEIPRTPRYTPLPSTHPDFMPVRHDL